MWIIAFLQYACMDSLNSPTTDVENMCRIYALLRIIISNIQGISGFQALTDLHTCGIFLLTLLSPESSGSIFFLGACEVPAQHESADRQT